MASFTAVYASINVSYYKEYAVVKSNYTEVNAVTNMMNTNVSPFLWQIDIDA